MKLILILLFIIQLPVFSQTMDGPVDSLTPTDTYINAPDTLTYPIRQNTAFDIGEKLTFKIRYGFIRAGTATMSVKENTELNRRPVYLLQTTAQSAATFSWIYTVDDIVNSFLDKQGLFSWKFEKRLREGGYKADLTVNYLPEDSLARVNFVRYKSDDDIRRKKYDVKTPPFVVDILGAFYYIRTLPLEVGKSFYLTNHDNKKVYELEVKVYRREIVEVEAGKFLCLLIEPLMKGEGIFKNKGRLKVWVTDDKYKIPVQMKTEIVVGHLTTELEKIEGLTGRIPARVWDGE